MREISRFADHALDEPSAFDQRVRLLRERTRLEASRLSEGEHVRASLNGAMTGCQQSGVDEGTS